jgi:clan AA aspartic protease
MLDTGFNGYLTLPTALIAALGLPLVGNRQATLADGSVVALDVYRAEVVWDGEIREVLVLAAEGGVLVGTALLYGSRVTVEFLDGGPVLIERLP